MRKIHGKEIVGAACLGALCRTIPDIFLPPNIRRTTKTGNTEETIDYRAGSMAGGAIRGGIAYFLVKGAEWGLGDMFSEMTRRYGDNFYNYVNRFRGIEPTQKGEYHAEGGNNQQEETRPYNSSHEDREEIKKRLNKIVDDFFGR